MTEEKILSDAEQKSQFPLIGTRAPEFKAVTTHGEVDFPADYEGKWVILFSHPADFTPVCTTEFMTFASRHEEYRELNTELIGLSVDSVNSHLGWVDSIKNISWKNIDQPSIEFPIIDDVTREVAFKYGMIQGESDTAAVRAVFFIDPEGIIKTILYYPASLGRNFDEIKRILVGLQKAEEENIALPADWKPGEDVIVPPPATTEAIKERLELGKGEDYDLKNWYLTFKKDK